MTSYMTAMPTRVELGAEGRSSNPFQTHKTWKKNRIDEGMHSKQGKALCDMMLCRFWKDVWVLICIFKFRSQTLCKIWDLYFRKTIECNENSQSALINPSSAIAGEKCMCCMRTVTPMRLESGCSLWYLACTGCRLLDHGEFCFRWPWTPRAAYLRNLNWEC